MLIGKIENRQEANSTGATAVPPARSLGRTPTKLGSGIGASILTSSVRSKETMQLYINSREATLALGTHEVRVTAKGFNTVVSTVTLAVGAHQQLNIPMRVGETTRTVHVTQAAPQIDLTSSTLTEQVESQMILELPLNGRDWTSLATLHPGVNLIETQVDCAQSARGNRGFGAELTISGQRTTNNNYRLDGVRVDDYAHSGPDNLIGGALGVDAIRSSPF